MPEAVFVADLGDAQLTGAVVGRDGKILAQKSEALDRSSPPAPVEQIVRVAMELAAGWPRPSSERNARNARHGYRAVAVAVPGQVRHDGAVSLPNLAGWERMPLARLLKSKLRVPVLVECDRHAAVLGEAWRGAGRGKTDIITLLAGNSVGAGIISEGQLLRGAHRLAGSAGWMAVSEADGFEVRKFGGLEAFASAPGIVRAARNAVEAGFGGQLAEYEPEAFTAEDIAELARRGDATAKQIFRRVGKLLGLGIANLIALFDPEVVVFSGPLAGAADLFWDELAGTALARCQPLAARKIRLCRSGLGSEANLLGAARLLWQASRESKREPAATPGKRRVGAKARLAAIR